MSKWIRNAKRDQVIYLGTLHPALTHIDLECHRNDWVAIVTVRGTTYHGTDETEVGALVNLLNYRDLIEALEAESQGT